MGTKPKIHIAAFKSEISLEAYKENKTDAKLISAYNGDVRTARTWKKRLIEGAAQLFNESDHSTWLKFF